MQSRRCAVNDRTVLGPWIRRFLMEHVVTERNFSRNSQLSYRDTLTLLLPVLSSARKTPVDRLAVEDVSPSIIHRFLEHVEKDRGCSYATRNQRLGTIHSLAKFIGMRSPQHIAWCTEVRAIPFKKTAKPVMTYLDKSEIDAILNVPDQRTEQGARDHALLLFLYNTGARVNEAAHLAVSDLSFGNTSSVRLVGNNRHQPLTRFGIYTLVHRIVAQASTTTPSLKAKRISPHSIRHTAAVHLLRAGVDINTIRAWLGHVSLDTTNVYAEIDLEMKAKALASCDISDEVTQKRKRK